MASRTGYRAAFVDVFWVPEQSRLYGGLLLLDGKGRPSEFVHTDLKAPKGFLWPEQDVRRLGTTEIVHALFDACRQEPALVVCRPSLGSANFCREDIAPLIPFAQIDTTQSEEIAWTWVGEAPASGHAAYLLAQELIARGFTLEPFERVEKGLCEVYPELAEIASARP